MKCLECESEQVGDAGECTFCGAPAGVRPTESAVAIAGRFRTELHMDEHGITVKNHVGSRIIGWDEVRWLRDGQWFSPHTRWVLEIVLKNGGAVSAQGPKSRTPSAAPETLRAIKRAARQHAIPAVLTGRPVRRFATETGMPEAGLYPDPSGEPGLREWDGTEWSPVLHIDPADAADTADAIPGGNDELATTWSPLPKQELQRHSETAASMLKFRRASFRALVVLRVIFAALLSAELALAGYWLASPPARLPDGTEAAVYWTVPFVALLLVGLAGRVKSARRGVLRHQHIAEVAREAAMRASAHDVASPPETTWIVSGPHQTELRLDDREITLRSRHETRWIAWDDVRWFRDGEYFHLSRRFRRDGWALAITLKDGTVVTADATKTPQHNSQQALSAVRRAARHHSIPAVLTGRPVREKPSPADKPGLHPDPGGEPGLREWTGTEWLPSLLVDAAAGGPPGQQGQVSIWSPLSREEQQRQWDAAVAAVPRRWDVALQVLLTALLFGFYGAAPAIVVVLQAVKHGWWLAMSPVAAIPLYAATSLLACGWCVVSLFPVHRRRAARKVARAARAASARATAEAV